MAGCVRRGLLKTDATGKVISWQDKSGQGHDVAAGGNAATHPQLVPNALNTLPVVRFSGGQILRRQTPIRTLPGAVTVIVVSRRSPDQAGGEAWQRLFSSQPSGGQDDNKSPNFVLTEDVQGQPTAYAAVITETEQSNVPIGPLTVGGSADGKSHSLRGDIAEVLVYNRAFLSQGDRLLVLDYLRTKWKAAIPRDLFDWTRVGSLGVTPKHLRSDLPLSDQKNIGHWKMDRSISDEFETPLNPVRWHLSPHGPRGLGGTAAGPLSPLQCHRR